MNIQERIELVRNDREHGSRWLVREAILILRDLATVTFSSPAGQRRDRRWLRSLASSVLFWQHQMSQWKSLVWRSNSYKTTKRPQVRSRAMPVLYYRAAS